FPRHNRDFGFDGLVAGLSGHEIATPGLDQQAIAKQSQIPRPAALRMFLIRRGLSDLHLNSDPPSFQGGFIALSLVRQLQCHNRLSPVTPSDILHRLRLSAGQYGGKNIGGIELVEENLDRPDIKGSLSETPQDLPPGRRRTVE